jgi:hypothetical protein
MPSHMMWVTRLSIQFTATSFQDSFLHTGCVYILVVYSLGDLAAWYHHVLGCLWYVWIQCWIPYICGPGYLSWYSNSLRVGRSGDQIQVGVRFSVPIQTGPGAHPASYTKGTGSFLGDRVAGAWREIIPYICRYTVLMNVIFISALSAL